MRATPYAYTIKSLNISHHRGDFPIVDKAHDFNQSEVSLLPSEFEVRATQKEMFFELLQIKHEVRGTISPTPVLDATIAKYTAKMEPVDVAYVIKQFEGLQALYMEE